MNKKQGFTLIELLVVIALIAIFASIVIVGVSSSRQSAADAGIKSNMNSVQKRAELYSIEFNSVFTNICNDSELKTILAEVSKNSGSLAVCKSDSNEWVVGAKLKSDTTKWWCIDSKLSLTKTSKDLTATLSNGNINCN